LDGLVKPILRKNSEIVKFVFFNPIYALTRKVFWLIERINSRAFNFSFLLPRPPQREMVNFDNGARNCYKGYRVCSWNPFEREILAVMVNKAGPFPWMPIFLLTAIFYLNFTSRVMLAPLLPVIEKDLMIGHGEAGSLFLYIACGYGAGLVGSGMLSSRLTHRMTITLTIIMVGIALWAISGSSSLGLMRAGLVLVGIFAGFYIPSAIATLTGLTSQEHWGKALAIHELGPNLGFITVPLLAEALLKFFSWRESLAVIAAACALMGVLFLFFGKGGKHKGEPPRLRSMNKIVKSPPYWVMISLFTVSIGSSVGLYTMIPLFLVNEMGMDRVWANTLIGFSRVFGVVILFMAGWITDRFGPKNAMTFFILMTGVFTLLFGALRGPVVTPILMFLQAASVACLFPVGFTVLSVLFPLQLRGVAVSLVMLIAFSLGGGLIPSAIGHWAEAFSFSSAFALLGVLSLALLPLFLRAGNRLEI
jgi:NNP family nitrate/nitrite transporter-like MFS transporter